MDPRRWEEIERLYHLARDQEAGKREKFLAEACGGDEALRREVESLLARPAEGKDFLEAPALEVAARALAKDEVNVPPSDLAGRTIAHYHILEKIGAGGMGVVYKARDLDLGRFVALKVLPPENVADPDRKRRFVQEARAASALNHPNIITIHEIAREGGKDFIVMEYVGGKTLDQQIGRRGLRLHDVLKYAVQIADALAQAHSAGIVHRDLKPTNIMVTEDGAVKVLDFGLAKLTEQIQSDGVASTATVDAESKPVTGEGVIIGTVSYMSPEQAEGMKVDARSDIFSFGSVLYEMVTGQRAFQGTSKISTLSAILHQEPKSVSTITPAIPADLEKLISRCLRKDPAKRFQHMADVKVALDELKEESESGRATAVEGAPKTVNPSAGIQYVGTRRWIWAFAALLAICLIGAGVLWFVKRDVGPPPELAQRRLTVNSSENPVSGGCISPDGKYVAYSDAAGIHLKLIETGEERLLRRPTGIAADAAWEVAGWFPDGSKLLANLKEAGDRSSVWVVSVVAEDARRLRDQALGYSVSPDGAHIAYITGGGPVYNQEIWLMDPQGEGAEKIVSGDENNWLYLVQWSPDSQRLAYAKVRRTQAPPDVSIETCTLKGTESAVVIADPRLEGYCWMPQGYILYVPWDGGHANLWEVQVSLKTGKAEGAPKRLTNWTGFELDCLSASGDGKRLALRKRTELIHVYVGDLADGGTRLKSVRTLLPEEAWQLCCSWTADSKEVLYSSDRSGNWAIYRQDIDGGPARLVASPAPGLFGLYSPDRSWILYLAGQPTRIVRVPVHGGTPQLVLEGKNMPDTPFQCTEGLGAICAIAEQSPDGRVLSITRFDPIKGRGKILRAIETVPNATYDWGLSPDGSTLAFLKREEPEGHIRLFSLTGGRDREITVKGWGRLQDLQYSPDGRTFYCGTTLPDGSALLRIDLQGRAQALWSQKGIGAIWASPAPDGRHLAFSSTANNSNIWIVDGF